MNFDKKVFNRIIFCLAFFIFIFIFEHSVYAKDLIISAGQSYTISQDTEYDEVLINGILYINKNNLTITTNNLTINSGGKITYTNKLKTSNTMTLSLIVNNNAVINGTIDFVGKEGNNGRNGTSGHLNGYSGSTGYRGKNIKINVGNELIIKGKINVSGGTGGTGGKGHDDDSFFSDPIGDGGNGGNGGSAGNIEIISNNKFVMQSGSIICSGGTGGEGGKGGDEGTVGNGGDGGDGGRGGTGGTIKIADKYINIDRNSIIRYIRGSGGSGGSGEHGADDGHKGSPGQHGHAYVLYGYGNDSGRYNPSTVYKRNDQTRPDASNFDIFIEKSNMQLRENIIINDNSPLLIWSNFIDQDDQCEHGVIPASGLKEYEIQLFNEDERVLMDLNKSPYYNFNYLTNGQYHVQIRAIDNNNNKSDFYPNDPLYFTIDTQPPSRPVFAEAQSGDITNNQIMIRWSPSTDINGISTYKIEVYDPEAGVSLDNTPVEIPENELSVDENSNYFYPLHEIINIESNREYNIKLFAKDKAGNYSFPDSYQFVSSPSTSSIQPVSSGWEEDKKRFFINLNIKPLDNEGEYYRYIREKQIDGIWSDDYISEWFSISVNSNEFIEQDHYNIESRTRYRYIVETKNSSGKFPWDFALSNISEVIEVENQLPIYPDVDNINLYPENNSRINENNLTMEIPEFTDIEGDNLIYNFYLDYYDTSSKKWVNIIDGDTAIDDFGLVKYTTNLSSENQYRWNVLVDDGYGYISTVDITGDYFYFTLDTTIDTPVFKIFSPEDLNENEITETNNNSIKLKIWNVSSEIKEINVYENNNYKTTITTDGIDTDYYMDIMMNEKEENKIIKLEASDSAGNIALTEKVINYDITAPDVPNNIWSIAGPGSGEITIEWDKVFDFGETASGVKGYLLSYTGSDNFIFVDGIINTYTIDGIDYNESVTIDVKTIDKAGNESTAASSSSYTFAETGNIIDHSFTNYNLRLNLAEVAAYQYMIRKEIISEDGEVTILPDSHWIPMNNENLSYIDTNLEPHSKYNYYIQTRNCDKEIDNNQPLLPYVIKVPNQTPSIPVIDSINYEYSNNLLLGTIGSIDSDGDILSYYFTLKDKDNNLLIDKAPGGGAEGLSYQVPLYIRENLYSGDNILWKVFVTDGYMIDEAGNLDYIESREITTIYDNREPAVNITTKPEDTDLSKYQSFIKLVVEIVDNTSGLRSVYYYWNQEDVLPEDRERIVLEINPEIHTYQFSIDNIPSGRNNLYIVAEDNAGNIYKKEEIIRLDDTAPIINNLIVTGQVVEDNRYITSSNSITAEWEIDEDFTDIAYYRYAIVTEDEVDNLGNLSVDRFTKVEGPFTNEKKYYTKTISEILEENNQYYFLIEVVNTVGLSSGNVLSSVFTVDSKPPVIEEITLENLITTEKGKYLNNINDLSVDFDISDNGGSGLDSIEYALVEDINYVVNCRWYTELEELKQVQDTKDGHTYYLLLRARDKLNQVNITESESFIIDQSSPVIGKFIAGSELEITDISEQYILNPGIPIPLSFIIDDEIEISSISYSIGNNPGDNSITQGLYPETDGWLELNNSSKIQQIKIDELLPDGSYYINLKVKNITGLTSVKSSNQVIIDSQIDAAPIINDGGVYTSIDDSLSFSWTFNDPVMEIAHYEYQVIAITEKGNEIIVDWSNIFREGNENNNGVFKVNISLVSGNTYFIKFRALYKNSRYSGIGISDGITVDTTYPENVYIDDKSFATLDKLYLEWGAEDRESGIQEYKIKIGSEMYGDDILDWVRLDSSGSKTLTGLKLSDNPGNVYYVTLSISNGADLTREISSDGFKVDNTPPLTPIVNDRLDYIKQPPLNFSWSQSSIDQESGLENYQISLLTERQITGNESWLDLGEEIEFEFNDNLIEGQWYYLAVKAFNKAGLESEVGYSDGILIDSSAPDLLNIVEDKNYLEIGEHINVNITARDQQSGISGYEYSIGTIDKPESIKNWTATELNNGAIQLLIDDKYEPGENYFIKVRAFNKVEDETIYYEGRSNGFMIIDGYPVIYGVKDSGDFTPINDQLAVSWQCDDTGYAPIKYYQVELSTDRVNWETAKIIGEKHTLISPEDIGLESFIDGETYYFSIIGVNRADRTTPASERGITDGIKVDNSPPDSTKMRIVHLHQYTTENYKIHLSTEDVDSKLAEPHSGITAYSYAIGTVPGSIDLTGGWVTRETELITYEEVTQLKLEDKQKYYLSFKVRNGTNLWSEIVTDEGLIADLTPPEVITLNSISDFITADKEIKFNWKAEDKETGICEYKYTIIDSSIESVDWNGISSYLTELNSGQITERLDNLHLEEGAKYKVAFVVKNSLGVWSKAVFSQELIVDTIKPVIIADDILVTNGENKQISWNIDEPGIVNMELFNKEGIKIDEKLIIVTDITEAYYYLFKENISATYTLEITAEDLASNKSTMTIDIRVNAAPIVTIQGQVNNSISIYKGRNLELSAVVNDPDGPNENVQYQWDFGDDTSISTDINTTYSYSEIGKYNLTLTCIDGDGGIGVDTVEIIVTNTLSGELILDEIWTGVMLLKDTVVVPEDRSLIIESGTTIKIPSGKSLNVAGCLVVNGLKDQEVVMTSADQKMWQGINVSPGHKEIDLRNMVIERAVKAVTLNNRYANLVNILFRYNKAGIHLYNSSPLISNNRFIENEVFGVKEDGDCEPVLENNIFKNNIAGDYYDSKKTVLSPEELEVINND